MSTNRGRPSLVGLTMYPAAPPYNGGSQRIYRLATSASEHFDVTYYAQAPRRLFSPEWTQVMPRYRERKGIDVLSFAGHAAGLKLGIPQLAQSATMAIAAPAWLRSALKTADLCVVEQPWQFRWVQRNLRESARIVYSPHNVELEMFSLDRMRGPHVVRRKLLSAIEGQERHAARAAHAIVVTSPEDADAIARRYEVPLAKIHVAPNGVDCAHIVPSTTFERAEAKAALPFGDRHIVVFCGAQHPPNKIAVDDILDWAKAWSDRPVQFVIIGSIRKQFLHVNMSNVTFTGFVPDVRPYFRAADVMINPMTSGGGTNLKQVEYLASGVPSVTTPFGVRGIPVEDGCEAFIRDIPDMPAMVWQILEDPSIGKRVVDNARKLAVRTFDWPVIGSDLLSLYTSLLPTSASLPRRKVQGVARV